MTQVTIITENGTTVEGALLDGREVSVPLVNATDKYVVEHNGHISVVFPGSVEVITYHDENGAARQEGFQG